MHFYFTTAKDFWIEISIYSSYWLSSPPTAFSLKVAYAFVNNS